MKENQTNEIRNKPKELKSQTKPKSLGLRVFRDLEKQRMRERERGVEGGRGGGNGNGREMGNVIRVRSG